MDETMTEADAKNAHQLLRIDDARGQTQHAGLRGRGTDQQQDQKMWRAWQHSLMLTDRTPGSVETTCTKKPAAAG